MSFANEPTHNFLSRLINVAKSVEFRELVVIETYEELTFAPHDSLEGTSAFVLCHAFPQRISMNPLANDTVINEVSSIVTDVPLS